MKRSESALRKAPDADTLKDFPRTSFQGTLHREHQSRPRPDGGLWWFASVTVGGEPEGRFDLPHPYGTCYLGETIGVAVRERCGRFLAEKAPIPVTHVEGRVVSSVDMEVRGLGDLTHPDGALLGVTAEVHSIDDYALTATWAARAHEAGMTGLRYSPRFTPGQESAYALFDQAGADNGGYPSPSTSFPLAQALVAIGVPPRLLPNSAGAVDDKVDPA